MNSLKIVSIIAIAISIVSIGWLLEINSNLQSKIEKLGDDLHQQSEISKSLDSELKSTNLLLDNQRAKIEQLESNVTMIREIEISGLLELQNKISDIQANMISMNNSTESLNKKVVNLEEKINTSTSIVPNQFQFETITLSDENNKNWTSNYIKENLYDAMIKSVCNSPPPHCYAHLSKLNTLVGAAMAIDTIGSSDSGYYFMGYSDEYIAPADGVVKISGKFLKKDDLILTDLGKNSTLNVFILGENPDLVINKTTLLDHNYTNGAWFSKEVAFKLDPGKIFRVGFGGTDSWIQDEKMYDSWAGVSISAEAKR
ncbi:MAG: hypothetical protein HY223_04955 [Thaumarchaeota archaeon]|nr:hypothetical protein [Nitrososphaerota archaeon]